MRADLQTKQGPDGLCLRIARQHHGVLTIEEALEAGLSRAGIHRRVEKGWFERSLPGVLLVSGAPRTWEQRVKEAQKWLGDQWFASHRCAGQIWRLDGIPSGLIELSGPQSRRGRDGIILHRAVGLSAADVVRQHGFRVSSPSKTLCDLGAVIDADDVEAALESALRKGLTSVDYLNRAFERRRTPGRNGVGVLFEVLQRRASGAAPTESLFETRLYQALRKARMHLPTRQYWIHDGPVRLGRVDFAYPDRMVVIEADSYENHSSRLDWDSDIARYNKLTSLGWFVLRITWTRLKNSPTEVTDEIARTLRIRDAGLL